MKLKPETGTVGKSYPIVHAEGILRSKFTGIAEGIVIFPVRGPIAIRMERRDDDDIGERGKLYALTPTPSTADLVLSKPMDSTDFWHGMIPIEGYWFGIRGEQTKKGIVIKFIDVKQPLPLPDWERTVS